MTDMKRIAQTCAFRLRDLADKLDREDAFVQSHMEHTRTSGPPYAVLPTVTFNCVGPNGTVEYVIRTSVRIPEIQKP